MNTTSRISIVIALVAFLIIVTNLAANVANLQKQRLSVTSTQGVTTTFSNPPLQFENGQPSPLSSTTSGAWYLVALIVVLASVVIYAYYKQRNRNWDDQPSILAQLPVLLIILAFFFLIYEAVVQGIGIYLGSRAFTSYLLIYIIIFSSALGLFFLFWRFDIFSSFRKFSMPNRSSELTQGAQAQEKKVEELKSIIDNAASSLYLGGDYRATIVLCYKQVLLLLERNGLPQKASLTAREFESEISSRLGVSTRGFLHELTLLFERARYSNEPISSEEAKEAGEILRQLSVELSSLEKTFN